MYYSERKRHEEMAKREAAGESLWSKNILDALRNKLIRFINALEYELNRSLSYDQKRDIYGTARNLLTADVGKPYLINSASHPNDDMNQYIKGCLDESFPDVLESLYESVAVNDYVARTESLEARFEKFINHLLASYRVSYSLENGRVVPFESRAVHTHVIKPTLQLLIKPGWEKVETPYIKAIQEIADNNPDDAITDATTAMQEALRILGCKGKDFKTLMASAKSTILAGSDAKYVDAMISSLSGCQLHVSIKEMGIRLLNLIKNTRGLQCSWSVCCYCT